MAWLGRAVTNKRRSWQKLRSKHTNWKYHIALKRQRQTERVANESTCAGLPRASEGRRLRVRVGAVWRPTFEQKRDRQGGGGHKERRRSCSSEVAPARPAWLPGIKRTGKVGGQLGTTEASGAQLQLAGCASRPQPARQEWEHRCGKETGRRVDGRPKWTPSLVYRDYW